MENVSKDVLLLFALELNLKDLYNFCLSSKKNNEKICNSETFWARKLAKDFKVTNVKNSKKIYFEIINNRNYCNNVYIEEFRTTNFVLGNLKRKFKGIKIERDDIEVFEFLISKLLYNSIFLEINFERFIKNINKKYGNRLNNTKDFTFDEYNVLLEILNKFSLVIRDKFLSSVLERMINKEIPLDVDIYDLCKYNIYSENYI